jgi:hypothetical protein
MIAHLGCRFFLDKFIGAAEILEIPERATELPSDSQNACLWLAEKQIKKNDLSPLLLRPSTDSVHDKACWLKGHTSIQKNMWGWGIQTKPADGFPRVQEHSVHLNLKLVGTITYSLLWDMEAGDSLVCTSNGLLHIITSAAGSTAAFIEGLENIDPASIFRSSPNSNLNRVPAPKFNVSSSKILVKILGNLLEQHAASKSTKEPDKLLRIYDSIVSLLAISASVPTPELDHFESFNFHQLHRHICDPFERTLVSISCSNCLKQSMFRVEIWQKPVTEARLYLIPGLAYQYTATSGTGIVMEEDRIIGRARFCASACNCNHSVLVEIP